MKSFTLTTNEVFALAQTLVEVRLKVHRNADGDKAAYRTDRNSAVLDGIVDAVRADLAKRVEEKCKGQPDDVRAEVFKELAKTIGDEKQELSLRALPLTGLSWSELDPRHAALLLKLDLVEAEDE